MTPLATGSQTPSNPLKEVPPKKVLYPANRFVGPLIFSIWEKTFKFLPEDDLKRQMAVCKPFCHLSYTELTARKMEREKQEALAQEMEKVAISALTFDKTLSLLLKQSLQEDSPLYPPLCEFKKEVDAISTDQIPPFTDRAAEVAFIRNLMVPELEKFIDILGSSLESLDHYPIGPLQFMQDYADSFQKPSTRDLAWCIVALAYWKENKKPEEILKSVECIKAVDLRFKIYKKICISNEPKLQGLSQQAKESLKPPRATVTFAPKAEFPLGREEFENVLSSALEGKFDKNFPDSQF